MKKTPNILIWKEGGVEINPKFAAHTFQTKGIPLEILEETLNDLLPAKSPERAYQIALAYDEAHNTSTAKTLLSRFEMLQSMPEDEAIKLLDAQ